MPLEFRCTSCAKLLRTPDESAGKKAKCPQCGAIVDVPLQSDEGARDPDLAGSSNENEIAQNPFATAPPPTNFDDPVNPYASPTTDSAPLSPIEAKGELQHSLINFDDVLRKSWAFFTQNLGQLALFGLVLFAMNAALQLFGQIGGMAVNATQEPAAIVMFTMFNMVLSISVQTYISLGSAIYMVKMARTRQAKINDLFRGGPFFLRGLGLTILLALIFVGLFLLCAAPALATIPLQEPAVTISLGIVGFLLWAVFASILWLSYGLLSFYFLVDRQVGVGQALRESARFMQGNKWTTFLMMVVVGFLGTLFICVTCTLGQILYIPFFGLLVAIIYLTSTGQPYDEPVT